MFPYKLDNLDDLGVLKNRKTCSVLSKQKERNYFTADYKKQSL